MIADPLLRWIVTALFALSAVECGYAIASGARRWPPVVGQVLHLVMAVAMAVMAWPSGAALPTVAPMVFFLAATAWFLVAGFGVLGHRLVNGYHAAMMLAMAWMYAVMTDGLLPAAPDPSGTGSPTPAAPSMPGMDMSAGTAGAPAVVHPDWVQALNGLCTVGFAVAALWWLYRYFVARKAEPSQPSHRFLGDAAQTMMAVGMAVMFGVLL